MKEKKELSYPLSFSVFRLSAFVRSLLLPFLLPCFPNVVYAQNHDLIFSHLTTQQGLSYNFVNRIMEDHYGFMWFATAKGLCRYDAKSFQVFRPSARDSNSISADNILCLYEDANHLLWIGTYDGGLNCYDPKTKKFSHYTNNEKDSSTISHDHVSEILPAPGNRLWVATSFGLNLFDPATKKFKRIKVPGHDGDEDNELHIYRMLADHEGMIWITGKSLLRMNPHTMEFTFFQDSPVYPKQLRDVSSKGIAEDSGHNIWVCTASGMLKYIRKDNRFMLYSHQEDNPATITSNSCSDVISDRDGKIWISTEAGISVIDASGHISGYRNNPAVATSINNNITHCLYESSSKIIWIGSSGGISYVHPYSGKFRVYNSSPDDPASINNNSTHKIVEDREKNLWIATETGFCRFNPATGKFKRYSKPPVSIASQFVTWVVQPDDRRNLWIGSWGLGLHKLDEKTNKYEIFRFEPGNDKSIGSDYITDAVFDKSGKLWIATWSGGVNTFDPLSKTFHRYATGPEKPNALRSRFVILVFIDSKDQIWIGSADGLQRYRPATDDFEWIDFDPQRTSNYANNITSICETKDGLLWVGTIRGMYRLDPETKQHIHFSEADGLPDYFVSGIVEDDQGNIWVSTGGGLAKMEKNAVCRNPSAIDSSRAAGCDLFKRYYVSDGLPSNIFNAKSYFKSSSGLFYFGTVGGLVSFMPSEMPENKMPPHVYITGIKVMGKEINDGVPDLKNLKLRFADKSVSFEFAALNFVQPEKNSFAYMLEGFEDKWQYSADRNFVNYTNLDPGNYVFRVKAANNDGIWNETGASIEVLVKPPFWRTPLFFILCTVSIIAGFFIFLRWRTSRLRKRNILLEETVALRTEELVAAKERAEQSEKFKQQFLANMSHEIRTPMNAVMGMTSLALETPLNEKQKSYLTGVKKASDNLLHIIDDILDLSKIEAGKIELENIDFSVYDLVQQVREVLQHKAAEKDLQLIVTIERSIPEVLTGDPVRLTQVLMNLAGNAIKFTSRGSVTIALAKGNADEIKFSVTDTGIGIPESKLQTIFESFSQAHASDTRKYGGTGLGLTISKQFIELMGSRLKVESVENSGTTFSFSIPLPPGSAERLAGQSNPENTDASVLNGLKILLVDDHSDNRIVCRDTLELKAKVEVVEAVNGQDALDKLAAEDFDVVLMDVQMPVMDGYTATKRLRSQEPSSRNQATPVIALTASVIRSDLDRCRESGMNDYVPKPFKKSQLITVIARVTGREIKLVSEPVHAFKSLNGESGSGVTNLSYLTDFCDGDRERMQKYINIYLESAPVLIEGLYAAESKNDREEIASLVHGFKTKLIMMGMDNATELAHQVELEARKTSADEPLIREIVSRLINLVTTASDELKNRKIN